MIDLSKITAGMSVIGADGVLVGRVAGIAGDRIKLEPPGAGSHSDHNHYVPGGLVADIEGDKVRLSATGANAALLDEEADGSSAD